MRNPDFSDKRTLEKYSSAFTLSDMEVFIFPELFYPLVISNIMSPNLWKWREDPWFDGIEKRSFTYKINRIKQFIIQNYIFNLDLATWGLTTKEMEINRFRAFFDMETLKQSNALFGYEGDRYYFSLDIRKHFGLDQYSNDTIPYWKTETLEAMDGFRHKPSFTTGAGECVSLSALYAAAIFVVGRVSLDDIFLMATPLHSQNFITEKEGVITNNRRIVTKNMWFNGTSLSAKARRALENEKITIVSHITGHIHTVYKEASISPEAFRHFSAKLREFLKSELNKHVFINFLRFKGYKSLFQYRDDHGGKPRYITLEKLLEYEHSSRHNFGLDSRAHLINEIDGDEFSISPLTGRLLLNDFEKILDECTGKTTECILVEIRKSIPEVVDILPGNMFTELQEFLMTEPRLPDTNKVFSQEIYPDIKIDDTREGIFNKVVASSASSEMALISLYVHRQMDLIDWQPFVKGALERNNVAFEEFKGKSLQDVFRLISSLENESIYPEKRLAQPDEVWNFRRGDGIEKAFLLASWIYNTDKSPVMRIEINNTEVVLTHGGLSYEFISAKGLVRAISIPFSSSSI
ncbi:MAG: hypothetical protein IH591_13765 [Bacteroidales bacterium]|nr:hypothetical protein [Bacteroidales bacterium]